MFRVAPRKTSAHFLQFLKQVHRRITKHWPHRKIIFVLDNYAIHKTSAVRDRLELHEDEISLLWFPTYVPHLNPMNLSH